jgi:hypothetical protein
VIAASGTPAGRILFQLKKSGIAHISQAETAVYAIRAG